MSLPVVHQDTAERVQKEIQDGPKWQKEQFNKLLDENPKIARFLSEFTEGKSEEMKVNISMAALIVYRLLEIEDASSRYRYN